MKNIPVVVTPLDEHMGLDIARSLGKRGIPVYGIDSNPHVPGQYSKYCELVLTNNSTQNTDADYLQTLVDFGKKLNHKAVLFPLSDAHVLLCSREWDTLQRYYEWISPDYCTMEKLLTKDGLSAIAEECGIPAPKTFFINEAEEIETVAHRVTYPAILKPVESTYWHTAEIARLLRTNPFDGRAKVIKCYNSTELLEAYRRVAVYDNRLIVQEVIPGDDEHLVYFAFYLNHQSEPLGVFAGRKYRVFPTGFGSASYVRSFYDPELEQVSRKLLSVTHYKGLGGVEFKKDPRDGHYKLIEFNARFGMWDGLGIRCGVDLPYIAYCDALHLPIEPQLSYRNNIIWVDWQRDIRAAFSYIKQKKLTFKQWLHSLRGEKMWAVYSKDDWRPGVAFTFNLAHQMWQRIINW